MTIDPNVLEVEDSAQFATPEAPGVWGWLARGVADSDGNEFIASTDKEARDGDVIDQATWRLGHYRKNPVILDNHDMRSVVGRAAKVKVEDGALRTSIVWDESELNPAGRLVAHQHREGFRKAVSVRWITGRRILRSNLDQTHAAYSKGTKVQTPWGTEELRVGYLHQSNALLEISSVSVPSDPRALQTRGMDVESICRVMGFGVDAGAARALDVAAMEPAEMLADEKFGAELRSLFLRLVRTDSEVQTAMRALGLTHTVEPHWLTTLGKD